MQHPDEGTIHAWLDDALSESEAAALSQHVATCAECAERVREARGLMAGASRIVESTDWGVGHGLGTPIPVQPKFTITPVKPKFWRRYAAQAQVIAAVLLVAVTTTLIVHSAREDAQDEKAAAAAARRNASVLPLPPREPAPAPPAPMFAQAPVTTGAEAAVEATKSARHAGARTFAGKSVEPVAAAAPAAEATPNVVTADRAATRPIADSLAAASLRDSVNAFAAAKRRGMALEEVVVTSAAGGRAAQRNADVGRSTAAAGCFAVSGDNVPSALPRRFVLSPLGIVRVPDGRLVPDASWRSSGAGTYDVAFDTRGELVLRIVGLPVGVVRSAGATTVVTVRRCD